MKIFILDDEKNARETVKAYLKKSDQDITVIEEASSIEEAIEKLSTFKPDLAFLDINLPDGLSFDLLARLGLDQIDFKIIFISAYDNYAIKAFKFNAIDYILKPVDPQELKLALDRAIQADQSKVQLQNLSEDFSNEAKSLNRLVLKDQHSIQIVNIADIVRCQSENNYTLFNFVDGNQTLITRTLKEYEEMLKGKLFFRPHKSHLINLRHLKKFDKSDGGTIEMTDGSTVPLSRFKKDIFLQVLDQL
ncbi:LytR/AlgR family response regulator transcription factor [Reichenbachiella ulvae]|uniref:LytTR family DNA-binding domain-containing protein n=1 Tax=Reichenbachiella ulvae TaxID=2980104 RepID=A0ABT3CPI7_9BACT|nr:LytTR family DNA-binding domain-containing protein [Reichenbachiella ulvae]MCV9385183.1 LytTR family DNA-binding domain-containing protein [Reichenbachiella ulvae]